MIGGTGDGYGPGWYDTKSHVKTVVEPVNRSKSLDAYRQPYVTMYTTPLEQMALKLYQSDRKSGLIGLDKLKVGTSYVRLNYGVFSRTPEYLGRFVGIKPQEFGRPGHVHFYNEYIPKEYASLLSDLKKKGQSWLPKYNKTEAELYTKIKGFWDGEIDETRYINPWNWTSDVFIPVPSKDEIDKLVRENSSNSPDIQIKNIIERYFLEHTSKPSQSIMMSANNIKPVINIKPVVKTANNHARNAIKSILNETGKKLKETPNAKAIDKNDAKASINSFLLAKQNVLDQPILSKYKEIFGSEYQSTQGGYKSCRKTRKHKNRKSKTRKH